MFKKIIDLINKHYNRCIIVKRYKPNITGNVFCYIDSKRNNILKYNVNIFLLLVDMLNIEEEMSDRLAKLHSLWRKDISSFSIVEHCINKHMDISYHIVVNYDINNDEFIFTAKKTDNLNNKEANMKAKDYELIAKTIDIELKKILLDKVKELNKLKLMTRE